MKNKGKPLFLFKQKSFDFIVEEKLPFALSGKGDAFFVYFEKQNITTMDVINFLCKEFNFSRLTLGVAWLKDKDAITRQWISIYKSALRKIGWEQIFLQKLSRITKIITTNYHETPIKMTDNITNQFFIRLRANQNLSQEIKKNALDIISVLFKEWFPNFFGTQRFGINGKNREIGKAIVEKKTSIKNSFEEKFKLQAYASWLFNQYLKERLPLWKDILEWEIIKNKQIMWPVFWYDIQLPKENTKARSFQENFMKKHNINSDFLNCYKKHKIFGIPRPIRIMPNNTRVKYQWDDLLIEFSLSSGAYASILIHQLIEKLEKLQENRK